MYIPVERKSALVAKALELLGVRSPSEGQGCMAAPGPAQPDVTAHTPECATQAPVSVALRPGAWIKYESPLFGSLAGEVLAVLDDGQIEVYHPVMLRLTRIPATWVRGAPVDDPDASRGGF